MLRWRCSGLSSSSRHRSSRSSKMKASADVPPARRIRCRYATDRPQPSATRLRRQIRIGQMLAHVGQRPLPMRQRHAAVGCRGLRLPVLHHEQRDQVDQPLAQFRDFAVRPAVHALEQMVHVAGQHGPRGEPSSPASRCCRMPGLRLPVHHEQRDQVDQPLAQSRLRRPTSRPCRTDGPCSWPAWRLAANRHRCAACGTRRCGNRCDSALRETTRSGCGSRPPQRGGLVGALVHQVHATRLDLNSLPCCTTASGPDSAGRRCRTPGPGATLPAVRSSCWPW